MTRMIRGQSRSTGLNQHHHHERKGDEEDDEDYDDGSKGYSENMDNLATFFSKNHEGAKD